MRDTVQPADLVVHADRARLAQLVANLVDNAVRHSPAGGEVHLSARGLDDERWVLEVRDEGPGIPADRAERVFERFGSGDDAWAAPASAWPSRAGSPSSTAAR